MWTAIHLLINNLGWKKNIKINFDFGANVKKFKKISCLLNLNYHKSYSFIVNLFIMIKLVTTISNA